MSTLKVNEVFGPTVQGEGPSQGRRVMFLRLSYCNLKCSWCDTKYTWDFKRFSKEEEVHEEDTDVILCKLSNPCKAVVISGGEPLLQQRELLYLVDMLKKRGYWVEIETNGTITPTILFHSLVDQFNCSPKLSNSGDSKEKRVKPIVLNALAQSEKFFFKFVVGTKKDMDEVIEYVQTYKMNPDHVYLMPLGKTREELLITSPMAKALADKFGFKFSSRLHVELYGTMRGV